MAPCSGCSSDPAKENLMDELLSRLATNLVGRIDAPMSFRFYLQPAMASIFAIISGLKDAKAGNPPYFWAMATNPAHRAELVKDGWKSVGKVFVLALMLDVIYQWIVQAFIYPGEAVIVAITLAILPYLVLRGLVTRIARSR
jgi:hypothetical protein